MKTTDYRDRLIFFGMILFLLGLLVGFVSPSFRNPRLGLSAHLEGVMNGMFLVIVGLAWDRFHLSLKQARVVFILLLWAGFINWLACILGGVLGASRMTPIAGAGFTAQPFQENLVAALFGSVGITMTVAVVIIIWGMARKPKPDL